MFKLNNTREGSIREEKSTERFPFIKGTLVQGKELLHPRASKLPNVFGLTGPGSTRDKPLPFLEDFRVPSVAKVC
jgi:hypothetical protein